MTDAQSERPTLRVASIIDHLQAESKRLDDLITSETRKRAEASQKIKVARDEKAQVDRLLKASKGRARNPS